jgi:hypothetical protein
MRATHVHGNLDLDCEICGRLFTVPFSLPIREVAGSERAKMLEFSFMLLEQRECPSCFALRNQQVLSN